MALLNVLVLLTLCFATLAESKDGGFVRRAAVDASGQVRPDGSLGPLADEHISMGVDAEGELVDFGDVEVDANDTNTNTRIVRTSGLKPDHSLLSVHQHFNFSNIAEQVPEDRQPCERPPPKRNRHKICQHKECGPPPNAYMLAIVGDNTMMESFSSEEDARMDGYWPGDVSRTEVDAHMVPDQDRCVCQGCDEWSEWAIRELALPDVCKFPDHEWRLVFSVMNPEEKRAQTVKFKVGRKLKVRNDIQHDFVYGYHLTKQVFLNSRDYKHVAKAEEARVWKDAHTIDKELEIGQGKNIAVYQFVLSCKLFNKVDMYVNELEFHTPHFVNKDDLEPPTCDPNEDGGFQECHKMASEEHMNSERGRTEQVNPTKEDAEQDWHEDKEID